MQRFFFIFFIFLFLVPQDAGAKSFLDIKYERNGVKESLRDNSGKYLLVKFWASWCGYCERQMPVFSLLKKRYENNPNIEFLPISIDYKGPQKIKQFYRRNNITNFDVLNDRRNTLFRSLGLKGVPSLLLISKEGEIIKRFGGVGHIDVDYIDKLVK